MTPLCHIVYYLRSTIHLSAVVLLFSRRVQKRANELIGLLSSECGNLEDVQVLLKNLFKGTIESMLEAEMEDTPAWLTKNILA